MLSEKRVSFNAGIDIVTHTIKYNMMFSKEDIEWSRLTFNKSDLDSDAMTIKVEEHPEFFILGKCHHVICLVTIFEKRSDGWSFIET